MEKLCKWMLEKEGRWFRVTNKAPGLEITLSETLPDGREKRAQTITSWREIKASNFDIINYRIEQTILQLAGGPT